MKSFFIAIKGKGIQKFFRRALSIAGRYGVTSRKMDRALNTFGNVLSQYECGASFPITAAALARNKGVIEKYISQNIEFAVHGFYHIDHSVMALNQQISDFTRARQLFGERGIRSCGFRSPYLRFHEKTLQAISETGFIYDSSSSLHWNVLNGAETFSYQRALEFYGAQPAEIYPSLPRIENGFVEIPYCLPDDEALVERLSFKDNHEMSGPWMEILKETYSRGELFTLGLHPERIYQFKLPLEQVLIEAHKQYPKIWVARLDNIAKWWLQLSKVKPVILSTDPGEYIVKVNRTQGLTILGRKVEIQNPSKDWDGKYRIAKGNSIKLRADVRPFIGISTNSDRNLKTFLRQQGYIVETAQSKYSHSIFLDYTDFSREDEKPLLTKLEDLDTPLLRFNRWPNEYKSALCITGDIDALTIWDYVLRIWRK
jgi:peptidoglycan/xylan/chitin deacetylase (PgdA/CDA1 family)